MVQVKVAESHEPRVRAALPVPVCVAQKCPPSGAKVRAERCVPGLAGEALDSV